MKITIVNSRKIENTDIKSSNLFLEVGITLIVENDRLVTAQGYEILDAKGTKRLGPIDVYEDNKHVGYDCQIDGKPFLRYNWIDGIQYVKSYEKDGTIREFEHNPPWYSEEDSIKRYNTFYNEFVEKGRIDIDNVYDLVDMWGWKRRGI
jgi:hypothetical protein